VALSKPRGNLMYYTLSKNSNRTPSKT